jgi:hypothetical protein
MQRQIEPDSSGRRQGERPRDSPTAGLAFSFVVHLLILLVMIFGPSWFREAPLPEFRLVPIDLVQSGTATGSPASPDQAPLPQLQAAETGPATATAVPMPETPPPSAQHHAAASSSGDLPRAAQRKPPQPLAAAAAAAPAAPSPAEDLADRLKSLARLRQPAPPVPPDPRRQEGTGESNVSAASADASRARDATFRIKDFIRSQVERHWYVGQDALAHGDWVAAIHIRLQPDGDVVLAEVVEDPRLRVDAAFRDFALSARNAVLLSAPIALPPGGYEIARDIVIEFHGKPARP